MVGREAKIIVVVVVAIGLALALSGCEPAVPEDPTDAPPEVEQAAMMALSDETGIAMEDMEIVDAEWTEWPDACLGLGEPDEVCAEVITPGWELTILAQGEEYIVRTDDVGAEVRIES